MKFPFITNPSTGKPDEMVTMTVLTMTAVLVRFLFDGITFAIGGQTITFGHVDAMVYASILAPVLGAHGFIINSGLMNREKPKNERKN